MTICTTNALYRTAEGGKIDLHAVHDTQIKELSCQIQTIGKQANSLGVEELVAPALKQLRAIRFALASTPLPGSHHNLKLIGTIRDIEQSSRKWQQVLDDAKISKAVMRIIPVLKALAEQQENPLGAKFLSLFGNNSSAERLSAVVLKETRYEGLVSRWIETACESKKTLVLGSSALRGLEHYDTLYIFGSPRWFRNDGAGFLFDAPRATHVHIIALAWGGLELSIGNVFPATGGRHKEFGHEHRKISMHGREESADTDIAEDIETITQFDINAYLSRRRASGTEVIRDDEFDTRLVHLSGNQAVLLDWDDQAATYCIDMAGRVDDQDYDEDSLVHRRNNHELEPGQFIILRTGGGGDLIPVLADHILAGNAEKLRAYERAWKERLRSIRSDLGEDELCRQLTSAGGIRANQANLRNWIRERTIRPDADADFNAILTVCGFESKASEYLNASATILGAHRGAGFRIRKLLIAEVSKVDFRELRKKGTLVFHLSEISGSASMTAYRIERIQLESVMAQSHEIGRPFEPEDELWL